MGVMGEAVGEAVGSTTTVGSQSQSARALALALALARTPPLPPRPPASGNKSSCFFDQSLLFFVTRVMRCRG